MWCIRDVDVRQLRFKRHLTNCGNGRDYTAIVVSTNIDPRLINC